MAAKVLADLSILPSEAKYLASEGKISAETILPFVD